MNLGYVSECSRLVAMEYRPLPVEVLLQAEFGITLIFHELSVTKYNSYPSPFSLRV